MCSGEMIESEIIKQICLPASQRFSQASNLRASLKSRCSTCDAYVDPMCAMDCPQFFSNEASLMSRCSTCDAYVDPMCAMDCPQ